MTAHWRDQAACYGKPTEWWFSDAVDARKRATAICAGCPVRTECAAFAKETRSVGMWAGGTRALSRNNGPKAPQKIHHGTAAGHAMHIRRNVPMCDHCRSARAARQIANRARRRAEGLAS